LRIISAQPLKGTDFIYSLTNRSAEERRTAKTYF
jgi:hypothetical protein